VFVLYLLYSEKKMYSDALAHFDAGLRAAQSKNANAAAPKTAASTATAASTTTDDVPPPPPPPEDDDTPISAASAASAVAITNAAFEKQLAADEIVSQSR
jgi:hypothetical protein